MNLDIAISELLFDTKGGGAAWWSISEHSSLWFFRPELVLCLTIVLLLFVRIFRWSERVSPFAITVLGSLIAFWLALDAPSERVEIFTGMLVYDGLSVFIRCFLLFFLVVFSVFTRLSGVPNREDSSDIYTLVLGATLGMCLMASANHLLIVFLSVEMASVPSYVLAATIKGRKRSSEAALKYAVYGAGAAGVMLYGISLICGLTNSAHLPTVAASLAQRLPGMPAEEMTVLTLAVLMVMVGLAFKLSAFPFHFWCPDVFEGASAEVDAFLSVASKAGALALLLRVAIGFCYLPPTIAETPASLARASIPAGNDVAGKHKAATENDVALTAAAHGHYFVADDLEAVHDETPHDEAAHNEAAHNEAAHNEAAHNEAGEHLAPARAETGAQEALPSRQSLNAALAPVRTLMAKLIALLAIITCTFGNLAAYGQTNIKRLFAYSTIAHAGYMMMAVPAILALAGFDARGAETATAALLLYVSIYLFMNLSAFSIIAFLRNAMGSEEIADYAGLVRRNPVLAVCFSLILFSLVGLPPLAGFVGKFAIFASLADGYTSSVSAGVSANYLIVLLVAGGLNTAVSLFYYLRVVKVMTFDPEPEDRTPFEFSMLSPQGGFVAALTLPVVALGVFWNGLNELALEAARRLLT